MGSPGASAIKKLPASAGDASFRSLGWEEPLEKETTTHSSIGEIPRTEEPGGLQSMRLQRVRHDLATKQQ